LNTAETLAHHAPQDLSDRFALAATRLMRALADLFGLGERSTALK